LFLEIKKKRNGAVRQQTPLNAAENNCRNLKTSLTVKIIIELFSFFHDINSLNRKYQYKMSLTKICKI